MKRIKAASLCQTLHFQFKEDIPHAEATALVKQEVEHYKQGLERNRTKFKIVEEHEEADGSILIKIIKQYNSSPVGEYMD